MRTDIDDIIRDVRGCNDDNISCNVFIELLDDATLSKCIHKCSIKRNHIITDALDIGLWDELVDYMIMDCHEYHNVTVRDFIQQLKLLWLSGLYDNYDITKSSFAPYTINNYDSRLFSSYVFKDPLSLMLCHYPELVKNDTAKELFEISKTLSFDIRYKPRMYYLYTYKTLKEFLDSGDLPRTHHHKNLHSIHKRGFRNRTHNNDLSFLLSYQGDDNTIINESRTALGEFKTSPYDIQLFKMDDTIQLYLTNHLWLRLKLTNHKLIDFLNNTNNVWLVEDITYKRTEIKQYLTLSSLLSDLEYETLMSLTTDV